MEAHSGFFKSMDENDINEGKCLFGECMEEADYILKISGRKDSLQGGLLDWARNSDIGDGLLLNEDQNLSGVSLVVLLGVFHDVLGGARKLANEGVV